MRWTQQELADFAGVGREVISNLEGGKTSIQIDTANRVLALFGRRLGPVDLEREGSQP